METTVATHRGSPKLIPIPSIIYTPFRNCHNACYSYFKKEQWPHLLMRIKSPSTAWGLRIFIFFQGQKRQYGAPDARCRVFDVFAYIYPCLMQAPRRVPFLNIFSFRHPPRLCTINILTTLSLNLITNYHFYSS